MPSGQSRLCATKLGTATVKAMQEDRSVMSVSQHSSTSPAAIRTSVKVFTALLFNINGVLRLHHVVACNCNPDGSTAESVGTCDDYGQCSCKVNVTGLKCDACEVRIEGTKSLYTWRFIICY